LQFSSVNSEKQGKDMSQYLSFTQNATSPPISARGLVIALGGRWFGRSGLAPCPAHADRAPSLSISIGSKNPLVVNCLAGCSFARVMAALRARGLAGEFGNAKQFVERSTFLPIFAKEANPPAESIAKIWASAAPLDGTLAARYLAGRAIAPPWPPTLRFCADLAGPAIDGLSRRGPALLALATINGAPVALQRTFLAPDATKSQRAPDRANIGRIAGASVHLFARDARGPLLIAEGVETALSAAEFVRRSRGLATRPIATLGAQNMPRLCLPAPGAGRRLIVARDNDAAGEIAARALAETAAGFDVEVIAPPEGVNDFNDFAQLDWISQ